MCGSRRVLLSLLPIYLGKNAGIWAGCKPQRSWQYHTTSASSRGSSVSSCQSCGNHGLCHWNLNRRQTPDRMELFWQWVRAPEQQRCHSKDNVRKAKHIQHVQLRRAKSNSFKLPRFSLKHTIAQLFSLSTDWCWMGRRLLRRSRIFILRMKTDN